MRIDDSTVKRLVELGRRNGNRLSVEQLAQILPVDDLSPGEIATLVERLDAEGVEVDLDEEWLKGRRPSDHRRGDGVVSIAVPAAPAVSAPGATPSRHGWADDPDGRTGHGHGQDHGHGSGRVPSWERNGVDMMPLVSLAAVALVLIVALSP